MDERRHVAEGEKIGHLSGGRIPLSAATAASILLILFTIGGVMVHHVSYAVAGFVLNCPWVEFGGGRPWFTVALGGRRLVVRRRLWVSAIPNDEGHVWRPASRVKELLLLLATAGAIALYTMAVFSVIDFQRFAAGEPYPGYAKTLVQGVFVVMAACIVFATSMPFAYPYGVRRFYALTGSDAAYRRIEPKVAQRYAANLSESRTMFRAYRLTRKGDHEGVVATFEDFFDARPPDHPYWSSVKPEVLADLVTVFGGSLHEVGRYEEVDAVCERVLPAVASTGKPAVRLSELHATTMMTLGHSSRALTRLEAVLPLIDESDAEYRPVQSQLALCLAHLGRHRESLAVYERLRDTRRRRSKDLADVENGYAYTLALMGEDLDRAETIARRAYEHNRSAAVAGTLGAVLVQAGDPTVGVELLEAALEVVKSPVDRFETYRFLAIGYRRLGDLERAEHCRAEARRVHAPLAYRLDHPIVTGIGLGETDTDTGAGPS